MGRSPVQVWPLAAVVATQLLLPGCFGAAAYVTYPTTREIQGAEMYSRSDKVASVGIDFLRDRGPKPDRVETDGSRSTFHYDRLSTLLIGPVVFVAPGYPVGLVVPLPGGRKKVSLTFENGSLVSARARVGGQSGIRFMYFLRGNFTDTLLGTTVPPEFRIQDITIRPKQP